MVLLTSISGEFLTAAIVQGKFNIRSVVAKAASVESDSVQMHWVMRFLYRLSEDDKGRLLKSSELRSVSIESDAEKPDF